MGEAGRDDRGVLVSAACSGVGDGNHRPADRDSRRVEPRPYGESEIQVRLFNEFRSGSTLIIPNYTPRGWFECDLFRVTKAGYGYEYEIKVTAADFRADRKKIQPRSRRRPSEKKVDLLEARACPIRGFWYVMPIDLVPVEDVPPWAGLIWARWLTNWVSLKIVRKAPKLSEDRVDQRTIEHAREVCYWRMWSEKERANDLATRLRRCRFPAARQ